jgi:hypothetical protein
MSEPTAFEQIHPGTYEKRLAEEAAAAVPAAPAEPEPVAA